MKEENKKRLNNLLAVIKDENRKRQVNNLLNYLKDHSAYFTAPASPKYHCDWEEGLLEHSMNVAENALKLNKALEANLNEEELVVCGLFHDCLPGDVRVSTQRGSIPIRDVNPGDYAVIDGINNLIINKWNSGEKECLRVETEFGYIIETSVDHKFAVLRDGNIEFIKASDLNSGDILQIKKPSFGFEEIPEAYLMGYVVGDGWLSRCDNSINVKVSEIDRNTRVYEEFEKFGGRVYEDMNPGERRIMDKLFICDTNFRRRLEEFGMSSCGSMFKRVPDIIFRSTIETTREFLRGLYDSDGSVSVKRDGSYINVNLGSISKGLLIDVQHLLLKYGIKSKLHLLRRERDHIGPSGDIIHCSDIYNLVLEGSESIVRFRDKIGFSLSRKQERLENFKFGYDGHKIPGIEYLIKERSLSDNINKRLRKGKDLTKKSLDLEESLEDLREKIQDSMFSNVRIKKIDSIGLRDCYDIEVDNIHQFIAEGFLVHNCGKAYIEEDQPYYLIKEATDKQKQYGFVPDPAFSYNNAGQVFMTVPQRAVRIVTQFVDISDAAYQAILVHDGQYVDENSPYGCKESPMALILHYADSWSGFTLESIRKQAPDGKSYVTQKEDKVGKFGYEVRVSQTC